MQTIEDYKDEAFFREDETYLQLPKVPFTLRSLLIQSPPQRRDAAKLKSHLEKKNSQKSWKESITGLHSILSIHSSPLLTARGRWLACAYRNRLPLPPCLPWTPYHTWVLQLRERLLVHSCRRRRCCVVTSSFSTANFPLPSSQGVSKWAELPTNSAPSFPP